MKSHVQVAVIGGGVVGCSVLYHLTKMGWKDVLLIERDELTSGSTWHAAGGIHTLNSDPNVAKLQEYTIKLYREIEEISGQSCGLHMTGGFMLAEDAARLDFLKTTQAKGKVLGMETEFISLDEVKKLHPLVDTSHFVGALYDPNEGHLDPSGVTHAYAKAARMAGAEIERFNPVTELKPRSDGGWTVVTKNGTVEAEIVVNAGGLWAREVGRLVGLELPVLAMEHHYLITEEIAEVTALDEELPHVIDFKGEAYMRQEGKGLLLGTYEKACVPWSEKETPADFGHDLLPPDFDRIAPSLEIAFEHFPCLAEAGIKQAINGPFTFAPDGNPLVGPVPGMRNFYLACGVMAGFSQGGGVGLTLAEWIVEGEPSTDIFAMDVARFGDFATSAYTKAKVMENYSRRFSITFPNEELPAARPMRTTPLYQPFKDKGAVFGVSYGLEHALWFAPEGMEAVEETSFRRSNAHEPVAAECATVREQVGLLEIATYSKYEVTGTGAAAFLDRVLANRLPKVGRMVLTPMLSPKGRLIGDLTVGRLAEDRFMLFGSGAAENYHLRWFRQQLANGSVDLKPLMAEMPGVAIAGPRSRDLLSRLTDEDVSNDVFRFFAIREMTVAGAPAIVARVSFTGELGYEIYLREAHQRQVYDALMEAGADLGLGLFGGRALNALRLEKSFGSWTREFTPDYSPLQAGMDWLVAFDKGDFIGRDAVLAQRENEPSHKLVTLTVEAGDADAWGDEPVLRGEEVVGFVTSGGYGHTVGQSIAMAYVTPEVAAARPNDLEIEILGAQRRAAIAPEALYDPSGSRMRA